MRRFIAPVVVVLGMLAMGAPHARAGVALRAGAFGTATEVDASTSGSPRRATFYGQFSDGTRTYTGVAEAYSATFTETGQPPWGIEWRHQMASSVPGGLAGTCVTTWAATEPFFSTYFLLGDVYTPRQYTCQLSIQGGPVTPITFYVVPYLVINTGASPGTSMSTRSGIFAG